MFREVSDNSMLYTYVHETITSSAKLIDTFNILNRKLCLLVLLMVAGILRIQQNIFVMELII